MKIEGIYSSTEPHTELTHFGGNQPTNSKLSWDSTLKYKKVEVKLDILFV